MKMKKDRQKYIKYIVKDQFLNTQANTFQTLTYYQYNINKKLHQKLEQSQKKIRNQQQKSFKKFLFSNQQNERKLGKNIVINSHQDRKCCQEMQQMFVSNKSNLFLRKMTQIQLVIEIPLQFTVKDKKNNKKQQIFSSCILYNMDLKKIGPLVLKQNLPSTYIQQAKIALSQMERLNPNSRKLCLKSCFTKHVDLLNQWLPLIEKYELPQLQQFNCSRNQLTSLNQLHLFSFPNLTTLILNNNHIHSLETLYRCAFPNLTELVLFSNRLSSLRGLEKLRAPFLVYLIVDNNDLVNMEGWARGQLHNLTQVQVDKNAIYDFKPLAKTYSPDLIQLRADNSDTAIEVPRLWPTFQRKWTQLDS